MTFVWETRGSRAVAQPLEQAKRLQAKNLEPAMPRLEPRWKLEGTTAKRLEKFEFLELEWL